jgi:hypothetical protein
LLPHHLNKEPILLSHHSTRSQFCHHTFASPNKQLFWLPHHFNKEPILLPHFCIFQQAAISAATLCILQTSSQFCCHTISTRSQFCCHTFASLEQAAIFATNLFKRAASSAAHISSNKLPALPLHLCISVPEATPATVAQVVTMDHFCKFMTGLSDLLLYLFAIFITSEWFSGFIITSVPTWRKTRCAGKFYKFQQLQVAI